MSRKDFTKLFNKKENVDLAIKLIDDDFSFSFIGNLLGCDRTSVYSFYKRMGERGHVFKKTKKKKIDIIYRKSQKEYKAEKKRRNPDKINKGKTYKEYLEESKSRSKKLVKARMILARKTLRELRKNK